MKFAPGIVPWEHPAGAKNVCPGYEAECGVEIKRKGKRGPLRKYCPSCRGLKKRAEWRAVKQRRSDRYGRQRGKGGEKERLPLSRGRATRWRFLAYYDGVENVAYIKTEAELSRIKNAG